MYGANIEVPHRCGRFGPERGEARASFSDFVLRMSEGSDEGPDPDARGRRGRGRGGPRGFGGPGRHGRGPRGRRARRGDIRLAILLLLDEEPRNGYGIMQEIEERSGGVWRPSPGSVYPALAQLEDEGLVQPTEGEGRKAFTLTEEGTAHVEKNREQMGTPWKTVGEGASTELSELRDASKGLAMAAMQVAQTGNADQLTRAKEIIEGARKSLYRLLAGDATSEKQEDQPDRR